MKNALKKLFGKKSNQAEGFAPTLLDENKIQIAYLAPESPLDRFSKFPMRLTLSTEGELIPFNYIFSGDEMDQAAYEQLKKTASLGSSMRSVYRVCPVYEYEEQGNEGFFVPINDHLFEQWDISKAEVEAAWIRFCNDHMNENFEFTP